MCGDVSVIFILMANIFGYINNFKQNELDFASLFFTIVWKKENRFLEDEAKILLQTLMKMGLELI